MGDSSSSIIIGRQDKKSQRITRILTDRGKSETTEWQEKRREKKGREINDGEEQSKRNVFLTGFKHGVPRMLPEEISQDVILADMVAN